MVCGGCFDSGGTDDFPFDISNFGGPMDFGPGARNVGVTVLNDLQQSVEVEYWSLPDPHANAEEVGQGSARWSHSGAKPVPQITNRSMGGRGSPSRLK